MGKQNDELREERLIKNEQLVRDKNNKIGKGIKQYFRGDKAVRQAPVAFICECSDINCSQHVSLSIDAYERLHARADRFVIFPAHETPTIEYTVANQDGFDIVEKFGLQP